MNSDLEKILAQSIDNPEGSHKVGSYTYKWEKLYRRNVVIFFYSLQDEVCKMIPTVNSTTSEINQVQEFADRSDNVILSMDTGESEGGGDESLPEPPDADGRGDLSTESPESLPEPPSNDSEGELELELSLNDEEDRKPSDLGDEDEDEDGKPVDLNDEDAFRKLESRYMKRTKSLITENSEEHDFDVHSVMKLKVLTHEVPVDRGGFSYKGYKFEVMLMTPGEVKGELIFEFTASPVDLPIPTDSIKKLLLDELVLRNQYLSLEKENQFTKFCEKLHIMIDSKIRFLPRKHGVEISSDNDESIHDFSESASILSRISNYLK